MVSDGVPSFVVGTGGNSFKPPGDLYPTDWNGDCGLYKPQSAFYSYANHGVLGLDLDAEAFGFEYVTVDGQVMDSGRQGMR